MSIKLIIIIAISFFSSFVHGFDPKGGTVSVIIPFAPGGGVDNSFKHLQQYAYDKGINLIPVFKAGAEGTIGIRDVANSSKNGYTIGLTTAGSLALYDIRNPDEKKVKPVTGIRTTVQVFVTHKNSNIKTFKDLEGALKEGHDINIGIGNPGQRIVWNQLFEILKINKQPTFIPYKGAGHVLKDIVGGHIDVTYLPITVLKGNIDSGDLIPLAVTAQLVPEWPDAPMISTLFKEWKDLEFGHVFFLPDGTDPEVVNYWKKFVKDYLNDPSTKKEFKKTYLVNVHFGPEPAEKAIINIKPKLENIIKLDKEKYVK
jgi:tripartite-type tricarboxylate transporter receptor subunit TctC